MRRVSFYLDFLAGATSGIKKTGTAAGLWECLGTGIVSLPGWNVAGWMAEPVRGFW
jgi:hypothetical protein